jgi:hypothetical protein
MLSPAFSVPENPQKASFNSWPEGRRPALPSYDSGPWESFKVTHRLAPLGKQVLHFREMFEFQYIFFPRLLAGQMASRWLRGGGRLQRALTGLLLAGHRRRQTGHQRYSWADYGKKTALYPGAVDHRRSKRFK